MPARSSPRSGVGVIGWIFPAFYVGRRVKERQKEIQRALPDALDMLVVCVEAGLGLNQALVRVAEEIDRVSPVLSEQLVMVNLEIRAGTGRDEALRRLADRTGVPEISSLVAMLIQTDRFGTSVAQTLRVQAEPLRTKRRQRAEEAAAKTAIKLVFPLVLFIFPALFVVILGPAMIHDLRGAVGPGAGVRRLAVRKTGAAAAPGGPRAAWRIASGCGPGACSGRPPLGRRRGADAPPLPRDPHLGHALPDRRRVPRRQGQVVASYAGVGPGRRTRLARRAALRAGAAGRRAGRAAVGRGRPYLLGGSPSMSEPASPGVRGLTTAFADGRMPPVPETVRGHRPQRRVPDRPPAPDAVRAGRAHRRGS